MKIKGITVLLLLISTLSFGQLERGVDNVLHAMTLDEKLSYIGGDNWLYIRAIPRLGLPAVRMSDGPMGVDAFGKSTAYPAGLVSACSWDTLLVRQVGECMARDAKARGVQVLLAPGVNIYRAPMCGRNFEYFGEDPFLTSRLAVNEIKGIQSQGVAATVKHFAGNNSEFDRKNVDKEIDERTLQEIYLPAFKAAVTEAKVACVMDAYNLLNGVHMSQNGAMNLGILKKDWHFDGLLMSDWHSTYDGIAAANNGLDLEMPAGDHMNKPVLTGKVSEAVIDDKVRRILRLIYRYGFDHPADTSDVKDDPRSAQTALDMARAGIVLLKNDHQVLPLTGIKKIAVIGPNAQGYIAGGGSSWVEPFHSQGILEGLRKVAGGAINVDLITSPEGARDADAVIVCVGFNKNLEQENFDRPFALPASQDSLIRRVARWNKRTIVVLESGGSVDMQQWLNTVPGLLYAGYPGQEGGQAIAEIVLGKINPSGKLAATFEKAWKDNPAFDSYYDHNGDKKVAYKEGLFIGYRGYEQNHIVPQFPFGFGLSYAQFAYSDLKATPSGISFKIKNTGSCDGGEVAQLYVHQQQCPVLRPLKELKGFSKVFLKRGESKTIFIPLDPSAFAYYHKETKSFSYDPGKFDLLIGSFSTAIHLQKTIRVQ